jgi:hypothetical protein
MGLSNFLEDISSEMYKPKLNAVGIDANGNYVDANGQPTTLYTQPGGFQRMFNPQARQIQLMNLAGQADSLQQQKENTVRNLIGGQNFNQVRSLAPEQLQGLTPTQGYLATEGNTSPSALGSTGTAITQNQLGMPYTTGAANTTEEQNRLIGARAAQSLNIPFNQQLDTAGNLQYDVGLNQARLGSLPSAQQIIGNQAAIGAATTGQQIADLPITTGTQRLQDIAENYRSGMMSDERTSVPYMATIGAQGVTPSGGVLNPAYRPPMMAQMAALQHLGNQPTGGTLSSGRGFTYSPPPPTAVPPTLGTNFQQGSNQNAATNATPVDKYPGYSVDFTTGRVFQDGQDVTGRVNPAILQAATEQYNESKQDVSKTQHDATQSTIAANVAALKAHSKNLQMHYERGAHGQMFKVPPPPQLIGYHTEKGARGMPVQVPDYQ